MNQSLTLLVPPAREPLTYEEVHDHLRLPDDYVDYQLIENYIRAARQYFEEHDDRRLIVQTWKLSLDSFPRLVEIPLRPVQYVSSVKYIDSDGDQQTLDAAAYQVDYNSFLTRIGPAYGLLWPSIRCQMAAVEVEFIVGYAGFENYDEYTEFQGDQTGIPQHLKHALLLHIGHIYENREDSIVGVSIGQIPRGYDALVGANRRMPV
jgi:uncharacterized phiE125 gp8 family phage protein